MATVQAAETGDAASIHSQTYGLLRQSLTDIEFSSLVSGDYAARMFADAEDFVSQLGMYEVKPAYVASLRALTGLGANPVAAIIWLSLIPGLLICTILLHWLGKHVGPIQAVLTVIIFSLAARISDLSRIPTPDNASALALLAGSWCLLAQRWTGAAVICFVLSIWVRTNNILFVAPLLGLFCWNHLRRGKSARCREFYWYSSGLAVSVISWVWISAVHDYQWWRLFYHTFVALQSDVGAFAAPFSPSLYLQVLEEAAAQLFASGGLIATVLPGFVLLWLLAWGGDWRECLARIIRPTQSVSLAEISLLCVLVFGAFLLLFPLISGLDRFLLPYYAMITVFAISRFSKPVVS